MYRKLLLISLIIISFLLFRKVFYDFSYLFLLFCYALDEFSDEKDSIQQGMYRKQRPPHVVLLKLPAQYGSEAVLKKIYLHSGKAHWKIHVR